MGDLERELAADDEDPEAWRPQVGDTLIGTLVRFSDGQTPHGDRRILIVEDEATGRLVAVWLNHVVLRQKIEKLNPQPGERIGLRRLQDHERGYFKYRVVVDREGLAAPSVKPKSADSAPETRFVPLVMRKAR